MATDLAEFLGAALGLYLLFGLSMWISALLTGLAAFTILGLQRCGFRPLEAVITGFVAVIVFAFGLDLLKSRPRPPGSRTAVRPAVLRQRLGLLAVGILGATVMPHVIYLHSSLTQNRIVGVNPAARRKIFRFEIVDISIAMGIAGLINMAMLVTAAAVFHTRGMFGVGNDLGQVFAGLNHYLGAHSGTIFGLALLASGIASSCVGTMSGQLVMQGFIHRQIPIFARRAITMIPALIVIGVGFNATRTLVFSQVFLSFGIPFALVPLLFFTGSRKLMGPLVNRRPMMAIAGLVTAVIIALNVYLLATG